MSRARITIIINIITVFRFRPIYSSVSPFRGVPFALQLGLSHMARAKGVCASFFPHSTTLNCFAGCCNRCKALQSVAVKMFSRCETQKSRSQSPWSTLKVGCNGFVTWAGHKTACRCCAIVAKLNAVTLHLFFHWNETAKILMWGFFVLHLLVPAFSPI